MPLHRVSYKLRRALSPLRLLLLVTLVLPVTLFAPCTTLSAQTDNTPAEWTIMAYICGDNNLEHAALMDLLEMEQALPDKVELIILLDRHKGYSTILGDWTGARLYRVRRAPAFDLKEAAKGLPAPIPQALASELLEDWGEVDMSDPATLTRFITTVAARFPARRYALLPWNHGSGWPGMLQDEDGGKGKPGRGHMTIEEFVQAAKQGAVALPRQRFDLLKFELCLMGQLDVLAASAQVADYAFASPPVEPGQGSDYLSILPLFREGLNTADLARQMVDANIRYYTDLGRAAAFSAYDLSRMQEVTAGLKDLTNRLRTLTSARFRELTRITCFSTHYENLMEDLKRGERAFSSVELADWLDRLEHEVPGAPVASIRALREKVRHLAYYVAATPNLRECKGLTLYIPLRREYEHSAYRATAFAKESGMAEYLAALYTAQDMLGKTEPQVSNLVLGAPRLKPGRDGRAAQDFDILPLQQLTPFAHNVVRFDVTGVGILMTRLLQFEQRGQERFLHCTQLVVDHARQGGNRTSGNALNDISPIYNDGTTSLMREISAKYKVTNGQMLGDITIENLSASREISENVSVGYGLYRDGSTGGQDLLVQVTFSNVVRLPIKMLGFQLDAQGRPVSMRDITLRNDGVFRPGITVLDANNKERRDFGPPMPLNSGVLLLTVDMVDEGAQVGLIVQAQTMNGQKAQAVSKTLPVRHDPVQAAMRDQARQHGTENLIGRYAMIQFAASGTGVDALPTFQSVEFLAGQPVSRWILRDGEQEKGSGLLNWLPFGTPQISLHKKPALPVLPLGETVQTWYAFLKGAGPARIWYCVGMGDGTRWAFVPLDQYQDKLLEGVWISKTERWEFRNGRVRLTRDGHSGEGNYRMQGHIVKMSNMPASEYAVYLDRDQGQLTLMSRQGAASILTREGGAAPEQQSGQSLIGQWLSGPETGHARLNIQSLPGASSYSLRLLSQGQGETTCTFTVAGNELLASFPNGSQERIRFVLTGNTLTLYFPRMPEIRFTRQ